MSNDNSQPVTFSSNTANTSGYPISASGSGGIANNNGYSNTNASFTLYVNAATPSDTSAPVITPTIVGTQGNNGWYTSDVSLTWSVTDPESATSIVKTGCDTQNITADQQATTYKCSATSDGGSAPEQSVTIKRDATPPVVSLDGGPADGGSYYFGSVPNEPTCQASDATSGLDGSCSVSGYSSAVGSQTVTANAKDLAGNTNSASNAYTVLGWNLSNFKAPVDMGMKNNAKAGSTVPLKFNVFAGPTELTNTSVVQTFTQKVSCAAGTGDDIEQYATGGTSLRYSGTPGVDGQFVFNWQTPKQAGACYKVTVTTQDGSSVSSDFQLR